MESAADKRSELVNVAKAMLSGQVHLIEGVRKISELRFGVEAPDDPVFHQIIAIDDDTDSFPLGDVRLRWSEEALRRSDKELKKYLDAAHNDILTTCRQIITKYSEDRDQG